MAETRVAGQATLKDGEKKVVKVGEIEVLLLGHAGRLIAVQSKCPHAGAPLEQGAVCDGRLVCPWHMGTFALPTGDLLEPPPLKGLTTYPVRVAGADVFIDTDSNEPHASNVKMPANSRTFLLAGAGAAGMMAAVTLRQEGFAGRIVAIDPVADEPLDRTQLSKQALAGKMPLEEIKLDALASASVERLSASITSFSAEHREAKLSNGETLFFDAALVATGGIPKRLEIPGAELAYTLRHSEDVRKILEKATEGKHAIVLGTSFIGLEAASALTQKGLKVTVVGKEAALPFSGIFGERVARAIVALHEKNGVTFRLGAEITAISADGITLQVASKPEQLAADLVLLGVGVAPKLLFDHDLPTAGDEIGGGIATDATLRVAENIFVGGDIANVNGTRIEHWRLAEQHGMLAARNMLGLAQSYTGVPFFWTFHFGKRLGYLGHVSDWDEIVYDGDVEALTFLAFFVKGGKVAAVLSCGRDHDTAALAEPMRKQPNLDELRASL